jgi:outer membrane protein assembly factor BamA
MFLGGPLTLRGFTNRGAGYQKEGCSHCLLVKCKIINFKISAFLKIECALGGNAYWLMGLHLYTPLPFLHRHKSLSSWLKTHSFLNMGNIASLNDSGQYLDVDLNQNKKKSGE